MNFALRRTISETVPKMRHFADFGGRIRQWDQTHREASRQALGGTSGKPAFLRRNHKNESQENE